MAYAVRPARSEDAEQISRVIVSTLRETNAKDYSEAVIQRVEQSFSPEAVLGFMKHRTMFVATLDGRIIGTASLDGHVVRTVFIEPQRQRQGVGRLLMAQIEVTAVRDGVQVLTVPSSITAESFYEKLGFHAVRDSYHGEERTIIMERPIPTTPRVPNG